MGDDFDDPEANLLAPLLHGTGWDVSGAGLHEDSDWMIDVATLSAAYGRKDIDSLAPYDVAGIYADAGKVWESAPVASGSDWEIDLGYDGPSGKRRTPGRKGRTL